MKKNTRIEIPVMFCFDRNYVIPAAVTFLSILENADKNYDYHFYVLHSDINEYQQLKLQDTIKDYSDIAKLDFINMEHRFEDLWKKFYKGGHYAKEVMYKILIASIFPQYEKIVVSDVDVVFTGDISKSYTELNCDEDFYLAGVKPIGKINDYLETYKEKWSKEEIKKIGTICGGYLVANLKKIREDKMEDVFVNFFAENAYRLNQLEQDIFNVCCYGKIKHLHLAYVACSYMWDYYQTEEDMKTDSNYSYKEIKEAMENPIQLHYATKIKPWNQIDCTKSEVWFQYLVKTPFLEESLSNIAKKPHKKKKSTFAEKNIKYLKENPNFIVKKNFYRILYSIFLQKYNSIRRKNAVYVFDESYISDANSDKYHEIVSYWNNLKRVMILSSAPQKEIKEFNRNNKKVSNIAISNTAEDLIDIYRKKSKNKIAIFPKLEILTNGAYYNLKLIEKYKIPFVVTISTKDKLNLNKREIMKQIHTTVMSPLFRYFIVDSEKLRNHLIEKKYCKKEQIKIVDSSNENDKVKVIKKIID